jgi:transcriptional regulator with XRE-family HTH domain
MRRTYGFGVPVDSQARLAAFYAFVRRALEHAKLQRGESVEDVAEKAGISANTIYLWRSGKGTTFPKGESVEAFCDALGIKTELALGILWPGSSTAARAETFPLGPDEDLVVLARRLADPSVPPEEKFLIRETIRGLAARSGESRESRRSREAG